MGIPVVSSMLEHGGLLTTLQVSDWVKLPCRLLVRPKDSGGGRAKEYAVQLQTVAKLKQRLAKQRLADTAASDDGWRLAAWVAGLDGVAGAVAEVTSNSASPARPAR